MNKKLKAIEETGAEYEKEVEKIKLLRGLYEEREAAAKREHTVSLEREKARLAVAEAKLSSSEEKVGVATDLFHLTSVPFPIPKVLLKDWQSFVYS